MSGSDLFRFNNEQREAQLAAVDAVTGTTTDPWDPNPRTAGPTEHVLYPFAKVLFETPGGDLFFAGNTIGVFPSEETDGVPPV